MAERKMTEYYSDELLAAVEQLRDGGNPHDIADRLTSLAVDMRNFGLVRMPCADSQMQLVLALLHSAGGSDHCNPVMESYAIVLKDIIKRISFDLGIQTGDIKKGGV